MEAFFKFLLAAVGIWAGLFWLVFPLVMLAKRHAKH